MQFRRFFCLAVVFFLTALSYRIAAAAVSQDRQLYVSTKKEYELIGNGAATPQSRVRLEKLAERFERIPQDYPKSAYADAGYYYAGKIYQEIYVWAKDERALDRAIKNLRLLAAKYPNGAYVAEGRYRLALALEANGETREARKQYALAAAKYSQGEWARKSRVRLAIIDARQDDKDESRQLLAAPAAKLVSEKESPNAVALLEKSPEPPRAKASKPAAAPALRKIVIDPGHGGRDPGAVGADGIAEKDIVLGIALKLAGKLKKEMGIEVVLTRKDDRFVPLEQRTALANAEGADLFISLHVNASLNTDARGVETYYLDNTNDEAALRMAARENGIAREKISDLQFILSDMVQNLKLEDSVSLAHRLQASVVSQVGRRYADVRDLGVKKAQFYVLVGARMPSVLVEMFFVTNRIEGRALATEDYQEALADALYEGVKKYQESAQVVKNL